MKVSIIVGGKFHAFNLAEQINKKKSLKQIVTSYPKYKLKKYGISKEKIHSIFSKELLIKFLNKLSFIDSIFDYNYLLCEYFDFRASNNINYKDTDILVGWSGFSKKCFIEAKKFDEVINFAKEVNKLIIITRGEKGALAVNKNEVIETPAKINLKIKDLTGAGDLFAGGFLHGLINNKSIKESLEIGTEMSSKVIQIIGARLN